MKSHTGPETPNYRSTSMFLRYLTIILALAPTLSAQRDLPRETIDLNPGWRFQLGDHTEAIAPSFATTGWESVDLPHTWNRDDAYNVLESPDKFILMDYYHRGEGWYRRNLAISNSDAERRLRLVFEGAFQYTQVWLNGEYLGDYKGGYSAFEFDISDVVHPGSTNVLTVRVSNAFHYDIPPHRADYTKFGGLYRNVYLEKSNRTYVEHPLIATPEVSKDLALVTPQISVSNSQRTRWEGNWKAEIIDPGGSRIAFQEGAISLAESATQSIEIDPFRIENPDLWHPDTPYLYTLRMTLFHSGTKVDILEETFGLRWFRFDPQKGFFINGEHLLIKGVNRHQDVAGYGYAVPDHLHVRDMQLIKEMGANFVRLAHYPQAPAVLEACDRLGLLVWEEIPVVSSVGREGYAEVAKQMMRDMITQHFNHPSIIIWGLMNETIRSQTPEDMHWTVDLCRELNEMSKKMDPTRYTAQAQFKTAGTDILEHADIRGWNLYYGWYRDDFQTFADFLDRVHAEDPTQLTFISEYGAGIELGYHVPGASAPDFSETWGLKFHRAYWEIMKARPWLAGSAVWNMYDFSSEEKGGTIPGLNQKGLADFARVPKDVYYYYQSVWSEELMAYIVSHTWLNRAGLEGELQEIEVLSNADSVRLFVNGEDVGLPKHDFVWHVKLKAGINHLRAVASRGEKSVEDSLVVSYTIDPPRTERDADPFLESGQGEAIQHGLGEG